MDKARFAYAEFGLEVRIPRRMLEETRIDSFRSACPPPPKRDFSNLADGDTSFGDWYLDQLSDAEYDKANEKGMKGARKMAKRRRIDAGAGSQLCRASKDRIWSWLYDVEDGEWQESRKRHFEAEAKNQQSKKKPPFRI